jgi:hypothetical protein
MLNKVSYNPDVLTCLANLSSDEVFTPPDLAKDFNQDILPVTSRHYLYLSGTPFRAIATGEFIEEQIFTWTYTDELVIDSDGRHVP